MTIEELFVNQQVTYRQDLLVGELGTNSFGKEETMIIMFLNLFHKTKN